MKEIYSNGTYIENNPDWHSDDSAWKVEKITNILIKNQFYPTSIAEIGCGAGEILRQMSSNVSSAKKIHGYEISKQAYDLCKKKSAPHISFFHEDILNKNLTNIHYDLIMAIDVIEHVEDYFSFLRKIKSCCKYAIIHVPLNISVNTVLRVSSLQAARKSVGHIQYFTKEIVIATLQESGFEIVDHCYTCGAIELPSRSFCTKILKLPRIVLYSINKDVAARTIGGFSLLLLAKA